MAPQRASDPRARPADDASIGAGGDAAIRTLEIQDLERAEAKDEGDGAEEETEEGEAKGK